MKKIIVKPVEPILIQFNDKEYVCTFSMLSTAYFQEELGKLDVKLNEIAPAHMASIILYSGLKVNHPEITLDETKALAIQMGPSYYGDIIKEWNDAFYDSMSDEEQKLAKKQMAQFIAKIR